MARSSAASPRRRRGRSSARRQGRQQVRAGSAAARWLLLIHQIPPKPDYLRVKISRRLQRVGAVAIKNSVYVLPPNPESYEDFEWIVREIEEGGGEAFISEASLVGEGLTDDEVRLRFDRTRNEAYDLLLSEARALLTAVSRAPKKGKRAASRSNRVGARQSVEHDLAQLRRRYESVRAIDFFGASVGESVAATLARIQQALAQHRARGRLRGSTRRLDGATWVTRRDVHVDRIASAWLIRRFIDRRPRFRFVDARSYAHRAGDLRFDMFDAEYTHVGDACTFERFVSEFVPSDRALREISEIVHDVDCKDGKFGRNEASGLARMIAGIAALCERDEDRLQRGARLFDDLYAAFGGGPAE